MDRKHRGAMGSRRGGSITSAMGGPSKWRKECPDCLRCKSERSLPIECPGRGTNVTQRKRFGRRGSCDR